MTPNSQEIVQQIRDKFEEIITFITQDQQESPSIYQTEKYLLTSLLSLGRNLLLAFIMTQQEKLENTDSICLNGNELPIHSLKRRSYRSIFGKLNFKRAYYYKAGQSYFLLDAKLKMPENSLSDLLREWLSELACYMPYHKTTKAFESILTQKFSCRSLEEVILEDSTLVEEFYQNNSQNNSADSSFISPATEAAILVAQADGKGIPMLPEKLQPIRVRLGKGEKLGQKKEAIVTSVYTIAPFVRTPEEVTISLFKENKNQENEKLKKSKKRVGPQNKQLWATLEGKKSALEFTSKQVALREGAHISMRVALTDGSAPLQEKMQTHLPRFSLVLDIIHAVEYLWEAGNSLHGEKSPLRQVWVQKRVLLLLKGQTASVISDLRTLAEAPECKKTTSEVLLKVANYYQRNESYMHYDDYLAAGWPIATGVIEGACRHLVKDRFELSGMHWRVAGAESLLRLRCVSENQHWQRFHCLRREREQIRLYGTCSAWNSPCIERADKKMKMPQVGYQVA